MKILVTGCAGFIGMHVCNLLLSKNYNLVGIDNLNDYYDIFLKKNRLKILQSYKSFKFIKCDIADMKLLTDIFKTEKFDYVIHLAAQAGVRYSITNPITYLHANFVGFGHILENCRYYSIKHLVYASSSSVYGGNKKIPFEETDLVDYPISLYASSKRANELMAHSYSHLYDLPTTGLRFFTVYGPWGRPDMSPYIFTSAIFSEKPINIFNNGDMIRDFTYIDDIVAAVVKCLDKIPGSLSGETDSEVPNSNGKFLTPYKLLNVGNSNPVKLLDFVSELELACGKKAIKIFLPMQGGDIQKTLASSEKLQSWIGYKPETSLSVGIKSYVDWFKQYYCIN